MENIDDLEMKLSDLIDESIFTVHSESTFYLEENSDPLKSYKIQCKYNDKNKFILIRPDKMKAKTNYLKKNPPRDCDYIILDKNNDIIYYLELKNSSDTSSPLNIAKQLQSGKKWLEHLSFLTKLDINLNDFKTLLICCKYDARQNRKLSTTPNIHGVYNMNGERLDLRELSKLS